MTQASKTRSHFFRILTLLALAGGVYYFADLGEVGTYLKRIPVSVALALIMMELIFYAIESYRLNRLSQDRYSIAVFLKSRLASGVVSNFLPGLGVGDLVRVLMLDTYRPGHKFYLLLLILASRLYGLMSLAALLFAPILLGRSIFSEFSGRTNVSLAVICLIVVILPLYFSMTQVRKWMSGIYRKLSHPRIKGLLRTLYLALTRFGQPKIWLMATVTSVMTSAVAVVQYWLVARAMGLELDLTVWMITVPLVSIVAFLPIGFGAFGSQEAGLLVASQVLGQPAEVFLAISAVIHASRILGTLPGLWFHRELVGIKALIRARTVP